MGRNPTPTALKALRGTRRPDRESGVEPQPPTIELGTKPPALVRGPRARQAWAAVVELLRPYRVATDLDAIALGLLVNAYGEYLAATDVIEGRACGQCGMPVKSRRPCTARGSRRDAEGNESVVPLAHEGGSRYYTTETESGSLMVRAHPAVARQERTWADVERLLGKFGMNPAERTRVKPTVAGEVDPWEEFMRGNRRPA